MNSWVCAWILLFLALPTFGAKARPIASSEAEWPQFRGPRRDGISDETGLLKSWPADGPKQLWTVNFAGRGFSSPIIVKDRLYITGDFGAELQISALDLEGCLIWKATNGLAWKNDYPGARASVTFNDGKVFHENAHGVIACLDAATGRTQWTVDLLKQLGGENIQWGLSECLLVDERAVYATAGGPEALFVALDKKSGAIIWKSESNGENAGYVSPILVEFAGRRLIIGCSSRALVCADADSGKIQWTQPMPTAYSVLASMPALVGDSIFMTAPHGKGGKLFKLLPPAAAGGKIGVEEVWTTPLDTCQGGIIVQNDKLFGALYGGRKGWAAVSAKSGEIIYQQPDFVKGCALLAENRLYALSEDGWMRLLEPTDSEFKVHGQFRLARAQNDAWAHPVIHRGRLYLRYHENLHCYEIKD